ncbi:hypothetical protein LJR030_005571 [Rhizobium sp. LjRoot30]|uniref:hypothetical protein n=1 Tax=Rhizobium sp. LjRoot30 TaxID=3342320 RepID=UPI003ECC866A
MYFAPMYKYGNANDKIGITGIIGCMGLIYVGHNGMYAIHIPDIGRAKDELASDLFIAHIKNNEVSVGGKHGHLLTFANGTNRTWTGATYMSAEEISKRVKKGLKSPSTTLYRIMKGLGPNSGGSMAKSVVILLNRVHSSKSNPSGSDLFYKANDDITWVSYPKKASGTYAGVPIGTDSQVPSELIAGWTRMTDQNCKLVQI